MLWSNASCRNMVSADQYHLTVARAQVSTHRGWVFSAEFSPPSSVWKRNFNFTARRAAHKHNLFAVYLKKSGNLSADTSWRYPRKFSQPLQAGKAVVFYFPYQWSRVGHALRPIFMLWSVKIWQVSSCGKLIQQMETCLLIAEADRISLL